MLHQSQCNTLFKLVTFISNLTKISDKTLLAGVLFALKVVCNHYNPGGVTYLLHFRVSNQFASWVELVLIYLIHPK